MLIDAADLNEIFRDRAGLDVVSVGFADPAKEMQRVRITHVEAKGREHVSLRPEKLVDIITAVRHMEEMRNARTDDLFVFGGYEQRGEADQLEFDEADDSLREEAVDHVCRNEQGFGKQPEFGVDFNEPVHQDGTHLPLKLVLVIHVVRVRHRRGLMVSRDLIAPQNNATDL